MRSRIFFSISLFALLLSLTPQSVLAHVLKADGSVGAVIHVSPEDDPIAGEPTDFFFEFKDKTGKFTPENCDCNGIILQGGKEIYSAPLFQNSTNPSLENASFSYTFPGKNIYKVRVSGKPNTRGAFEPFTLEWDIRVARESTTLQGNTATPTKQSQGILDWTQSNVPQVVGFIIVLISLVYLICRNLKRKTTT